MINIGWNVDEIDNFIYNIAEQQKMKSQITKN